MVLFRFPLYIWQEGVVILLSITAGTTVVLSLKNQNKNQTWAFDFVYRPLKLGFICFPLKGRFTEYPDKSRLQGLHIYMPVPKSRSVLLSNPTVWNWGFLSWRHVDSLCHPPRPVVSGSNPQCINAGPAGPQPVVHGSLPTGQTPRWAPELNVFLLQCGTLLFYFWRKHFSHFIVLFEIKHSSNLWVFTTRRALC